MEKIVTDELSKTLIILGMGVMSISVLFTKMLNKVRGSFKTFQKPTLIYLVIFFLFFSIIACASIFSYLYSSLFFYIFYQFYFLALGIAHSYYMLRCLKWSGDNKALWLELIFTIITGLLGGIGFICVYSFFNHEGFVYVMVISITAFPIPWFIYQTFQKAIAIPPKVMKQWFYPLDGEIEELGESKLKNLLIISFEFQKQISDSHFTKFRAKAPIDMEFGDLFCHFINECHKINPINKIHLTDCSGESYGWIFYKKPKWFTLLRCYINSDKTIFRNKIKENDIIICNRVLN